MKIGGLQKLTLIDFPDRIACTVFSLGCNYRCPFCYNPELVLPEKMEKQPPIAEKDFFDFLAGRKELLEGVVLGGGEPTIHQDLPAFVKKIKKLGFLVKLDTNGSNPRMLKKLIDKKLVDYVAMDIKAPRGSYRKLTGRLIDIKDIEKSINILKENKVDHEFRTTITPTLLEKEDIIKIAKWLSPAKKYFLQNFRPEKAIDPELEKIKPYSDDYLSDCCQAVSPFFETCRVR